MRVTAVVCLLLLLFPVAAPKGANKSKNKTPKSLVPEECPTDPNRGQRSKAGQGSKADIRPGEVYGKVLEGVGEGKGGEKEASPEGEGTEPKKEIHRVLMQFKLEDDPVLKWVAAATGGISEQRDETGKSVGPEGMSEEEVSAYLATQGTNYWFDQATLAAWFDGIPFLEQVVELVDSVYYGPSTRILILNLTNKQVAETVVGIVKFSDSVEDCALDSFWRLEQTNTSSINDPKFKQQWGMKSVGLDGRFSSGSPWNITTGDPGIVVAVMDTGIDYTHPDLKPNMWRNEGEIPGNGIDDDGNGYVDDVYGFNFVEGYASESEVMDDSSHGTHCAGIIGAKANNKVGVAGVAPDVSLMALKVFPKQGDATTSSLAQAVEYAIKMEAHIISASLGGSGGDVESMWKKQQRALNQRNILLVAAAGNEAMNNDFETMVPCNSNQPNVICVASAWRADGCLSAFSNYGKGTVDIVAPGTQIWSTVPRFQSPSRYDVKSGTSMATPFVSGAAALILSFWKNSGETYIGRGSEVKDILLKSAKLNSKYTDFVSSGGSLDVVQALTLAQQAPAQQDAKPSFDSNESKVHGFQHQGDIQRGGLDQQTHRQQMQGSDSNRLDRHDVVYSQQQYNTESDKLNMHDIAYRQQQYNRDSDRLNRHDVAYSQQQYNRGADRFDRRDMVYNQQPYNRDSDMLGRHDIAYSQQQNNMDSDRLGVHDMVYRQQQYSRGADRFDRRDMVYNQQVYDRNPDRFDAHDLAHGNQQRYERYSQSDHAQRDWSQYDQNEGNSRQVYHG